MKAQWRRIPRDDVAGQWAALYATLNRKGQIVLSRRTYEKLGAPKAFNVFFDDANQRIGLKATALGSRDAYPAGIWGKHGGKVIRVFRLMHEAGIVLKQTIQFPEAEIDMDGILVLDLRTAKISARAAAHAGARKEA